MLMSSGFCLEPPGGEKTTSASTTRRRTRLMYSESASNHLSNDGEEVVDWCALAAQIVHPTKMQIIEAMRWIGEPISAVKLEAIFDKAISLSNISYHVDSLAKLGTLKLIESHQVRGAHENFYYFTSLAVP
jgi:hypothetical protein